MGNYIIVNGKVYNQNNELYHYGVVGMKWGVRRASKKGTEYSYTSMRTKKYAKKSAKLAEKAKKMKEKGRSDKDINELKSKSAEYAKKSKISKTFDKKMEKNVRASSGGKVAAKVLLNGFFGAKTYEAAKAYGFDRGGAQVATMVSRYLAGPVGNLALTSIMRSQYIKERM